MGLFESLCGEWIRWRRHNTNPGYQVEPMFLQADQPIRLQYSRQISLIDYMLTVRWWRQEAKWRNDHDECDDEKPSDDQSW